jgi:Carboxypeptidase regulatory-like domain
VTLGPAIAVTIATALAPQLPDAAPPAIVSGRVVDADSGRPIAGAIVMPFGTAAPAPPSRVLTNANGQFVIRGVRAGDLVLLATRGGYIDAAHGQARPGGYGQRVAITAGRRYLDVDIRMWRHGVITGTVTDEAGEAVIGVRVQAFLGTRAGGRTAYAPAGSAATDDRGVYRIPLLAPGSYLVAVLSKQTSIPTEVMDVFFAGASTRGERDVLGREMKRIGAPVVPGGSHHATSVGTVTVPLEPGTATPISQGGALFVYPTTFYPAASSASQAATVPVRSGLERANVDLQLRLERTARVSGMLAGQDAVAAHVPVRLIAAGNEAIGAPDGASTLTDSTGAFTFAGVTPGQYTLFALRVSRPPPDPPDDAKMTVQAGAVAISPRPPAPPGLVPPPPVPADATLWARMPIAVGETDLNDVIVALRPGPRMSGRLEFDGTADLPDPTLVSNLQITLEPADGSPTPAGMEADGGHPDEHGGFRTPGVPPGRYVVRVSGLPLPGWTFKGARYGGRDLADTAIEMSANDVDGVVLAFTDRPASIAGAVQAGTQPDPDAIVAAYPVDEDAWTNAGAAARRIKVTRASSDGTFTIANVPAGEYYVVAVKDVPASWLDPALLRSLAGGAQQVRVVDGERKAVSLRTVPLR